MYRTGTYTYLVVEFSFRPRSDLSAELAQRGATVADALSESNTHIIVGSGNAEKTIAELENKDQVPVIRELAAWALMRGGFDDVTVSLAVNTSASRGSPEKEAPSPPKEVEIRREKKTFRWQNEEPRSYRKLKIRLLKAALLPKRRRSKTLSR